MAKDINKDTFDEATKLKLAIFGECFKEWLPVFLHDKYSESVYIYDFFAGSGTDSGGHPGSPLILLSEAKGDERRYCYKAGKDISFIFNEGKKRKSLQLQQNVQQFVETCQQQHHCEKCVYEYHITNADFRIIFQEATTQRILKNPKIGKFILLDQYGFKQIDDDIFTQLVGFPKTDFIFFISSSFIRRFKEHSNTRAYIDTQRISFDESRPEDCHRAIADYFRQLVPREKEYYLHHFTIQKERHKGNYYGLIFGTNHTLGMEKFLKVCWQKDNFSGEANFTIDNDFPPGTLFYNVEQSNKKQIMREDMEQKILSGELSNNIVGLKYALQHGCEPKLFTQTVQELEQKKRIQRTGLVNNSSSNIHKVKPYDIKVCCDENN